MDAYPRIRQPASCATARMRASAASTAPELLAGVPQYNADRGVVGKCDMCHGRLSLGQAPACKPRPEGAIAIEIVNIAEWRTTVAQLQPRAQSRGGVRRRARRRRQSVHHANSTNARRHGAIAARHHARDARTSHWPLVIMTVLTQLSVGAFTTIWLLQLLAPSSRLGLAAIASLLLVPSR